MKLNKKQRREAEKAAKAEREGRAAKVAAAAAGNPEVQAAVVKAGVATAKAPKAAKVAKVAKVRADGLAAMPGMPRAKGSRVRKPKPTHPCACGCGGATKATWAPGHDARAKGWAIRINRGVIAMGDVPANERDGARLMLKVVKGEAPPPVVKVKAAGAKRVKGENKAGLKAVPPVEQTAVEAPGEVVEQAKASGE